MPNTTNSIYVAPTTMASDNADAAGNLVTSGWSSANFSGTKLEMAGNYGYSNRSYTMAERGNTPVQAGHLYALEMTYESGDEFPPIFGVRLSMRNSSGGLVSGWVRRVGGPLGQGTIGKSIVFFHVPDDGSVQSVKLGFNKFIGQAEGARGTSYLTNLKMVDYGRNFDAGNIWLPSPPAAIVPFNSGNGEIVVNQYGGWSLDGVPTRLQGVFTDWDASNISASYEEYRDVYGFNTCYHINPMLHRSLVPAGMYVIADWTGFIDPGNALYNNQGYIQAVNDMVADFGDRWVGNYFDMENSAWDSYGQIERVVNTMRARMDSIGTHRRPMLVHCQNQGGAEALNDLFDVYEGKNNPFDADFGAQDGVATSYDHVQGQIGYAAQRHPRVKLPYSNQGYNVPHTGSQYVNNIVNGVIKGMGISSSLWGREQFPLYHNHNRGPQNQPWSSTSKADFAALDALLPMLEVPATDVYNASVTGIQDGSTGVQYTLRQVGSEIYGVFSNLGASAEVANIDTPDQFSAFSQIAAKDGTATEVSGTKVRVNLSARGYAAFKLTPGLVATADLTLPADVNAIGDSSYSTTAVVTGSTAPITWTVSVNGVPALASEWSAVGEVLTLTPAQRPAAYTVSASITDGGQTYADSQVLSFSAQSVDEMYTTSPTMNLGNENGSQASLPVTDMANDGTEPYTVTGISILDSNGSTVSGATAAIDGTDLVVTQGDLPPGTYTIQSTVCDSSVTEPPPSDPAIAITAPVDSAILGINQAFNVSLGGEQSWRLVLGSSAGLSDIYDSGLVSPSVLSVTATGLPTDGSTVYATATTTGASDTAQYIADNSGVVVGGTVILIESPIAGDTLAGSQTFGINCQNGDLWVLTAGSSLGDNSYYESAPQACSIASISAAGWPLDGNDVFVTIAEGSMVGGSFVANTSTNYVYQTQNSGTGVAPEGYVATPANGSTINSGQNFVVNYQDATRFTAEFGSAFNGNDLLSVDQNITGALTGSQTVTLNNITASGSPVYLKMVWYNGAQTLLKYYQYTAGTGGTVVTPPVTPPVTGGTTYPGLHVPSDVQTFNFLFGIGLGVNDKQLSTEFYYDGNVPTKVASFTDAGGGSILPVMFQSNIPVSSAVMEIRKTSATGTLLLTETFTPNGAIVSGSMNLPGGWLEPGEVAYVGVRYIQGNTVVDGHSITFDVVGLTQAEYAAL